MCTVRHDVQAAISGDLENLIKCHIFIWPPLAACWLRCWLPRAIEVSHYYIPYSFLICINYLFMTSCSLCIHVCKADSSESKLPDCILCIYICSFCILMLSWFSQSHFLYLYMHMMHGAFMLTCIDDLIHTKPTDHLMITLCLAWASSRWVSRQYYTVPSYAEHLVHTDTLMEVVSTLYIQHMHAQWRFRLRTPSPCQCFSHCRSVCFAWASCIKSWLPNTLIQIDLCRMLLAESSNTPAPQTSTLFVQSCWAFNQARHNPIRQCIDKCY